LSDLDEDAVVFDPNRIGLEVDAGRRSLDLAGLVIEGAVVFRALE
jgi:hypothetical protein